MISFIIITLALACMILILANYWLSGDKEELERKILRLKNANYNMEKHTQVLQEKNHDLDMQIIQLKKSKTR